MRLPDLFHKSLSLEDSPFCFVVFLLEVIPLEWYSAPGRSWEDTKAHFREAANQRELYWIGRLNTLWPRGYNSAIPGKPISCGVQRNRPSLDGDGEPVRFVDCSEWLDKWKRDATAFLSELQKQSNANHQRSAGPPACADARGYRCQRAVPYPAGH